MHQILSDQPDQQLKLKLYHENLLKSFTKSSLNKKILRSRDDNTSESDLLTTLQSQKVSDSQIEGMIMKRMRTLSPKKKKEITQELSKKLRNKLSNQKIRPGYHKAGNESISTNEFVSQIDQMPVKMLNEPSYFRTEYSKKITKLNDLFKENINSFMNQKQQSKAYQTPDKNSQTFFRNELLTRAISQFSQSLSEKPIHFTKKQPDSIPPPRKTVDLRIDQLSIKNVSPKNDSNSLKKRAKSAHNEILTEDNLTSNIAMSENQQKSLHYDFKKRFYRMRDLDKLLAKSLTIAERGDIREYEKNKLLKGALRTSSNLNYHMDAVLRSIAKGKIKPPSEMDSKMVEAAKDKILKNLHDLQINTKKIIDQKVNSIDKMLLISSGTLKFRSPKIIRPETVGATNARKKSFKRLELRSKVMKKSRILEMSLEHSALAKKSRLAKTEIPGRDMSYVNYYL